MTYHRRIRTGGTFFFTLVSLDRRPILCRPSVRDTLRRAIEDVRQSHPFSIDGWVLMPDHLHGIWTLPEGDPGFSTRWTLMTRAVASFAREIAAGESTHPIRDATDFDRHLDYIHFNPVRHGHAARAIDWPYSTLHRYVRQGVYPADWDGGPDPDWGDPA